MPGRQAVVRFEPTALLPLDCHYCFLSIGSLSIANSEAELMSGRGMKVVSLRGRKIAKVAVARRLAVRLYWMWRKGWDYEQTPAGGKVARPFVIGETSPFHSKRLLRGSPSVRPSTTAMISFFAVRGEAPIGR
jgi:hypothetical protein